MNPLREIGGYHGMVLNDDAYLNFKEGRINGIVTDSQAAIIDNILKQEIITYCSPYGQYSFDWDDLVDLHHKPNYPRSSDFIGGDVEY